MEQARSFHSLSVPIGDNLFKVAPPSIFFLLGKVATLPPCDLSVVPLVDLLESVDWFELPFDNFNDLSALVVVKRPNVRLILV